MEKLESLCTVGGSVNWCTKENLLLGKIVWWFLKKLKIELLYDPSISTSEYIPQRVESRDWNRSHIAVHGRITCNNQKVEGTQMPFGRRMDRQNAVGVYHGILLSFEKEGNPVKCCNMDKA